ARIYAVKVGLLGPPPPADPKAPVAKVTLREYFRKTKVGDLPTGWQSGTGAASVQQAKERVSLELPGDGKADVITLPAQSLKGDFILECEFETPDANANSGVAFHFEGKAAAAGQAPPGLILEVYGDGKMAMTSSPPVRRYPPVDAAKLLNPHGHT